MYENDDDQPIPQYDGNISLESNEDNNFSNDSKNLESFNEIEPNAESENEPVPQLIPVIVTATRQPNPNLFRGPSPNVRINHRGKKVVTASQLPVIVNLNPRSVYNTLISFFFIN